MKIHSLLAPTLCVILSTSLSYFLSKAVGMPPSELKIVAIVSFSVSATAAFGAFAFNTLKQKQPSDHEA